MYVPEVPTDGWVLTVIGIILSMDKSSIYCVYSCALDRAYSRACASLQWKHIILPFFALMNGIIHHYVEVYAPSHNSHRKKASLLKSDFSETKRETNSDHRRSASPYLALCCTALEIDEGMREVFYP